MSEHHSGPVETGAPMNYSEHEKTYDLFVAGTKYCTAILVALLIAMAAGFFGSLGLLGGTFLFIVLSILGVFFLR